MRPRPITRANQPACNPAPANQPARNPRRHPNRVLKNQDYSRPNPFRPHREDPRHETRHTPSAGAHPGQQPTLSASHPLRMRQKCSPDRAKTNTTCQNDERLSTSRINPVACALRRLVSRKSHDPKTLETRALGLHWRLCRVFCRPRMGGSIPSGNGRSTHGVVNRIGADDNWGPQDRPRDVVRIEH